MNDKVVLITGASMGMGKATAIKFAEAGASVAIADINLDAAKELSESLNKEGHSTIAIHCDVADGKQVKAMVEKVVETYGRLDAAFNNAGIQIPANDITEISEEDYDRVLNVNLKSVWLCMKHELIQMRKQQSGAIVNNSSIARLIGNPGRSPYAAAKHGIVGLTKSVALDYAAKGIRINAICPGTIETSMVADMIKTGDLSREESIKVTPMNRLGQADEIASTILWLCGPGSSFIVGQAIPVDGGYTVP